jgi:acetylornithine deacetylase/succinyl-diaminopimelate desuccinylase-like protein
MLLNDTVNSTFFLVGLSSPYIELQVTVRGSQGHAGTVPMSMRQDPMAAAAELIVLLERLCKHPKDFLSFDGHCNDISVESLSNSLVCTVGEISTWPSASNVIPGQVRTLSTTMLVLITSPNWDTFSISQSVDI